MARVDRKQQRPLCLDVAKRPDKVDRIRGVYAGNIGHLFLILQLRPERNGPSTGSAGAPSDGAVGGDTRSISPNRFLVPAFGLVSCWRSGTAGLPGDW